VGSGLQAWQFGIGAAGTPLGNPTASTSAATTANIFDNNLVSYNYAAKGFSATLGYGVGGVAGSNSSSSYTTIGLTYENGPLAASFGTFTDNDSTSTNKTTEYNVGASYKVGAAKVTANYLDIKPNQAASATVFESTTYGLGVDYAVTAAANAFVAYYSTNEKYNSTKANRTIVGVDYSLSKTTGVYAAVVNAKNNTGATYNVDESGITAAAGTTVTAWTFGLHKGF
jgi:predicted porin